MDTFPNSILVVDDEESIRKSLSYILSKKGYQVKTAAHADVAVEILNSYDIDLVISDIVMPDISGLELVQLINKQHHKPEILLITGEPSLESATSAVKLGVFDYVSKPVKKRALLDIVHRALEKKSLLDEKERLLQKNARYLNDLEKTLDQRTYKLLLSEELYRGLFENTNVGICIISAAGAILKANPVLCRISKYSQEDILDVNLKEIFVESTSGDNLLDTLENKNQIDNFETKLLRANGEIFWANLTVKKISYNNKPSNLLTILDISNLKNNELNLQRALADKEEMLREIHHRTKNNMNVIISLLNMQSYSTQDQQVKDILAKVNNRIFSMSMVHEQIYLTKDLSAIDLSQYINALFMRQYAGSDVNSRNIKIDFELDEVKIGLSQAIPLGLALNEIIANAINHPFSDSSKGKISIQMKTHDDNEIQIKISDNGKGYPDDMDLVDPGTLGLHMTKILVEDQLSGTFKLSIDKGASAQIKFALAPTPDATIS